MTTRKVIQIAITPGAMLALTDDGLIWWTDHKLVTWELLSKQVPTEEPPDEGNQGTS